MKELILHPSRNFLDARNPSSPFQYMMQMNLSHWERIYMESNKMRENKQKLIKYILYSSICLLRFILGMKPYYFRKYKDFLND